jgi:hypothetical protein
MTDDATYADALQEIYNLRRKLRGIEEAAGINPAPVTYSTDQLGDADYYRRHKEDIHRALGEPGAPRIVESETEAPVRVEYPPTDIPRLTQVGPGMYVSEPLPPKSKGPR